MKATRSPLPCPSDSRSRFLSKFVDFACLPFVVHPRTLLNMALCFGAILLAAQNSSALPKPGSTMKDYRPSAENHKVTIHRAAETDLQKRMIAAAEASTPDQAALEKAIQQAAERPGAGAQENGKKAEPPQPGQWWFRVESAIGKNGGIRIPFAVTGDAVEYYKGLVEGYRNLAFKNRHFQPSSHLEYQATVEFHDLFAHGETTFRQVHVVTLTLSYKESFVSNDGMALSFKKQRTVILDGSGKTLQIDGDGPAVASVMAF